MDEMTDDTMMNEESAAVGFSIVNVSGRMFLLSAKVVAHSRTVRISTKRNVAEQSTGCTTPASVSAEDYVDSVV